MKIKRKLGMGCKKALLKPKKNIKRNKKQKKIVFGSGIINNIHKSLKKRLNSGLKKPDIQKIAKMALIVARKSLKASGGKRKIQTPRIIPIPKQGGILPLIPIFAGLSALGSLAGGAAGIVRAINTTKNALAGKQNDKKNISEGKNGSGIYLKPYRSGLGLYLKPYKSSKNY